jgi:excisionase family DNA binding protein
MRAYLASALVRLCTTLCYTIAFMTDGSDIPSMRIEPWASVEELTVHLGVARDTIYRWIEAKHMPAHRIGRLWKFKLSEVDSWVRAGGADEIAEPKVEPPEAPDR